MHHVEYLFGRFIALLLSYAEFAENGLNVVQKCDLLKDG